MREVSKNLIHTRYSYSRLIFVCFEYFVVPFFLHVSARDLPLPATREVCYNRTTGKPR